jgi:hypothetical protein
LRIIISEIRTRDLAFDNFITDAEEIESKKLLDATE